MSHETWCCVSEGSRSLCSNDEAIIRSSLCAYVPARTSTKHANKCCTTRVYTALARRSSGQGRELNVRASITFSKTHLILRLPTTNTRTHRSPSLSHTLLPSLPLYIQCSTRVTVRGKVHVCMHVCAPVCLFVCGRIVIVLGDIVSPDRGSLPCVSAQGLSLRLRLWSQLLPAAPESSTLPE